MVEGPVNIVKVQGLITRAEAFVDSRMDLCKSTFLI